MSETITELAALRATVERIRAALDWVPERPTADVEAAIAADLHAGLSLRACAKKYAVTFGRVRGIKARSTSPGCEAELPWCDLKVAYSLEDEEQLWTAHAAGLLNLPDGWELNETDCSGARCVAIFRCNTIPTVADGERVLAALENAKGGGR